jgi:hypothetical protein
MMLLVDCDDFISNVMMLLVDCDKTRRNCVAAGEKIFQRMRTRVGETDT